MSLDAGSVYATLGGKFSPAGFNAFGSAMYRARADMERGEKAINSASARASRSLHNMGQAAKIGAAGGIAALGAVIGYSIKKAADFEQQLDILGAKSNASARQLALLKKQALEMGAATKYSALDAAKAQTELSKGGMSVTRILGGGLQGALALAAAGEMDLTAAAGATVKTLKQFKMGAGEATAVADALATAANQTTYDVSDFTQALAQGGGAAKSAGWEFRETVTAIEALATQTSSGSDAGTSLKTALIQLLSPTKQQAEAAKKAGLSFIDQSGSMKSAAQISAMLRRETGDMNKAQRTALFTTLAGTDGFRTLLALYDAGPAKLRNMESALAKQGTAAKTAAEQQDNLKGKWENFTGSIETAGIMLGEQMLPSITKGVEGATSELNHLAASGKLEDFGQGLVKGGEKAVDVGGDVAHVLADIAHAATPVVGALDAVGDALDLGNPTHIEAILAAIAGFKIASTVTPMVVALGQALGALVLNARTAPSFAAFIASLGISPWGAIAAGVGAVAAAFVLLSSHESHESQVARENAAAHKAQMDAINALHDAESGEVDKKLAAQRATLDVEAAEKRLSDLRAGGAKKSSLEYRQAVQDLREATARSAQAHRDYNKSLGDTRVQQDNVRSAAQKRLAVAAKELDAARQQADVEKRASRNPRTGQGGLTTDATTKRLERAQRAYNDAMADFDKASRTVSISQINVARAQAGAEAVTTKNAAAVQFLAAQLKQLPKDAKPKISLTGNQDTLAQLGELSARLMSVGKSRTVARVLANASSAQAAVLAFKAILAGVPAKKVAAIVANTKGKNEVDALRAAINGVQSKSVTVSTTTINRTKNVASEVPLHGAARRAMGRGPIGAERALVGEGRGPEWYVDPATGRVVRIDHPQLMDIPKTAYIIPTEDRYRGTGIGLLADVARDLGVPGYAKGKKPHYRPSKKTAAKAVKQLKVPDKITYAAVPEDELKDDVDAARKAWKKRDASIKSYEDKVRTDRAALKKANAAPKSKGKKKAVAEAKGKLSKDEAQLNALKNGGRGMHSAQEVYNTWREQSSLLKKLQAANREIERLNTIQETDRQKMSNAAGKGDESAYNAAQADRTKILGQLKASYEKALGLVKDGSKFKADLESKLATVEGDLQDAGTTYGDAIPKPEDVETEADRIGDTGMTDAERARLSQIDKNISLAALTQTLDDDKAAAAEKEQFLTGVLGLLTSGTRTVGNSVIADVADQLKSARDNVASLTTGGATNDNADLQAQLDQANERTRIANENARINRQALEVFGGSGDIGAGGMNARSAARGAAPLSISFASYVPPSPQEALRLAGYVAGGFGYQPTRPSKTLQVG